MKLSRRKSFSPIGVDVDGRSIAAVQLSLTGEGFQIEAATVLGRIGSQFPPEQPELHRLSEVLARQGFQGKKLVLGVPSDQVLASMLDLPPAGSGAPLEQIARIELARIHKCEPADLELAMWNLPPRQRASGGVIENRSGTHVMAVACSVSGASTMLDAYESQGFDVTALDVQMCAMNRACEPMIPADAPSAALLDLRWNSALLVLRHQGAVVYQRTLADAGMRTLRDVLMSQAGLSQELADLVLAQEGMTGDPTRRGPRSHVVSEAYRVIASHLDSMVQEVRTSCAYLAHRYGDAAPKLLLLTGEGASIPGVADHLSRVLEMTVKPAETSHLARYAPTLDAVCCNPILTTALGLAMHGAAA